MNGYRSQVEIYRWWNCTDSEGRVVIDLSYEDCGAAELWRAVWGPMSMKLVRGRGIEKRQLSPGRIALLVAAFLFMVPCVYALWRGLPPDTARADAEQYRVYSAYIRARSADSRDSLGVPPRMIFIDAQPTRLGTEPAWRLIVMATVRLGENVGMLFPLLVARILESDVGDSCFRREFDLAEPYELARPADVPTLLELADSRRQVTFTFSRVVLNPDLTEAVFFVQIHCGSLCGEESYVFLKRSGSKWEIVSQLLMGVA